MTKPGGWKSAGWIQQFVASLIPVPPRYVTGIQPTRVCAAKDSFQPKDLGWKDSCDEHRNEEVEVAA
jgi:hypothetical protein